MNGRVRFDYTPIFGEPSLRMDAMDMHITNDEKIKTNDWCLSLCDDESFGDIYQCKDIHLIDEEDKKIIMTTDPKIIKDGVQEISMEVLEWYAKNPTHDFVKIEEEFQQGTSVQVGDGIFKYVPSKTPIIYNVVLATEKSLSINDFANVFKIPIEYFGSKNEPITHEDRLAKALTKYVREKHTQEECIGFIDGFNEKNISEDDIKHLNFIFDRLCVVHNENVNYDYMIKFKEIITKLKR